MTSLLAVLPALLCVAAFPPDGGAAPDEARLDAGEVPTVIPTQTSPSVAEVLAPELAADGGAPPAPVAPPAAPPESLSVYDVNLPAEAALTVGFFGLYFMVDVLVKPSLGTNPSCLNKTAAGGCNPADLSDFDRYAVGRQSPGWRVFSDVALAASLVIPVLYLGLESLLLPTREPWGDFLDDVLVVTEALALTAAVETVLKFTVRRPRPSNYLTADVNGNIDQQLSMPSGHTSLVAAATTALTTTVFLRHPQSKIRFVVLGAGVVVSVLTGLARVESGQHFPTDAITGLLIGGAAGFAVPYLHRKTGPVTARVSYDPATGTTMIGIAGRID